ncbi:MAG: hypothetical protein KJZ58_12145 [Flavobacteriales bacterium]|nr:hypothetical protein [Flavobacteriales bacterium]
MRTASLLAFLLLLPRLFAQEEVRITDPKAMEHARDVRKTKGAEEALLAAGLNELEIGVIREYGDREDRPQGIRGGDSTYAANAPYIINYTAFKLCTFQADTQQLAVVMLPAASNIHMPEDMRPLADFYVVVPDRALKQADRPKPRPEVSRGPRWKTRAQVKIIKPDELYAAYNLAADSAGLSALARTGMSRAEVDAVVFRSTERNWPEGIDSFEDRYPRIGKFTKYRAYLGARWGDKVLLIIPVEKNRRMPTAMRPYVDLYFVYNASSVKILGR